MCLFSEGGTLYKRLKTLFLVFQFAIGSLMDDYLGEYYILGVIDLADGCNYVMQQSVACACVCFTLSSFYKFNFYVCIISVFCLFCH